MCGGRGVERSSTAYGAMHGVAVVVGVGIGIGIGVVGGVAADAEGEEGHEEDGGEED